MKHIIISTVFFLTTAICFGQGLVKIGDKAPKYYFNKLVNSPNTNLDISDLKGKPTLLAFWGTWCAPCIPEMIKLGKLQKTFGDKVQIVGVSNDNEQKLKTFLLKRPSKIWFASDPSNNLWNIFNLQTAGYSVLIDKNNNVVSVTETEKIDSITISDLFNSKQINLEEDRGGRKLGKDETPVKLDSSVIYSFAFEPERKGIIPMLALPRQGIFANRRITIINLVPAIIFREAYNISTSKKIVYGTKEDSITSHQNAYCVDLIVPPNDNKNLKIIFQNELNNHLPFRAEIKKKLISCYVLRPIEGKRILLKQSTKTGNKFTYNNLEFGGEGILMKSFITYLENSLNYPIYDATGLTKYYDIDFSRNNIEQLKSTKESLEKLGLEIVKDQKEMEILYITTK